MSSVNAGSQRRIEDGSQRRIDDGSPRRVNAGTGDQAIAEYWPRHPWRKSASPANGRRKSPTHREWVGPAPRIPKRDYRRVVHTFLRCTGNCFQRIASVERGATARPYGASGSRKGSRNLLQVNGMDSADESVRGASHELPLLRPSAAKQPRSVRMSYAKSVSAASLAASLAMVLMISANALTTGNAASADARAATTPSGGPASFSQASNASPNGNLARGDRTFMRKAAQG